VERFGRKPQELGSAAVSAMGSSASRYNACMARSRWPVNWLTSRKSLFAGCSQSITRNRWQHEEEGIGRLYRFHCCTLTLAPDALVWDRRWLFAFASKTGPKRGRNNIAPAALR